MDFEFNRSSISRPQLSVWWLDENQVWVTLAWGTKYADPVWSVSVEIPWRFRPRGQGRMFHRKRPDRVPTPE